MKFSVDKTHLVNTSYIIVPEYKKEENCVFSNNSIVVRSKENALKARLMNQNWETKKT